ncbi:E3 ubiquitin-protein ligase TRIM39-like [Cynoglossus semilaevis]|uniref:E3 ubiquitin-protein ligase TRIM39-like n=1 Tax=Cynoglossus semilaevis TaxID=244447 RepID=UPI0004974CBC|nr:E3 ubiquitin-protein ligase TRIM39-like [Cynoglossus semilaevis]
MAAPGANLKSEDHFLCSICLSVFTDPVSTPCGHNFCKKCITKHWNISRNLNCPMCKEVFSTRPHLKVNCLISQMISQFRYEAPPDTKTSNEEIQEMTQDRLQKIDEIKHSMKMSQVEADREITEGVQVFTTLKDSVDRGLNQFIKEVQDRQTAAEKQANNVITELEDEITEMVKMITEVDYHRNFSSKKKDALCTRKWTTVRFQPPSYEGTVMRAVDQLEEFLKEQMTALKKGILSRMQQFEVDVTLDPNTAQQQLVLSEDRKLVHFTAVRKNLLDIPERFSHHPCVLATQSFSSGRFYFEVQVKGKTDWVLGVARESINRKGELTLIPQYGYWTTGLRHGKYIACDNPPVSLPLVSPPERVGVFVDYDTGLVSFYDVDAAVLIYSFTSCSFTDKLYPLFSPWFNDGGKNSAPLIICRVNQTN